MVGKQEQSPMWYSKMQQVYVNVERVERVERECQDPWHNPSLGIDATVILAMEPQKLREITMRLGALGLVRDVLEAAQKRGHDISQAVAVLSRPPWDR